MVPLMHPGCRTRHRDPQGFSKKAELSVNPPWGRNFSIEQILDRYASKDAGVADEPGEIRPLPAVKKHTAHCHSESALPRNFAMPCGQMPPLNWRFPMFRTTISRIAPVLFAAALLTAAPSATAAPERDKPDDINFLVPAGEGCDFPLQIEGTASNANILTFRDEDGEIVRTITAGRGYTLTYSR
ncbi:hypothetical protein, partial [Crystallibacter crystallopoietes]|uniref:hypothetical protein n=1 Tax=Crystallibacter crystallopoietes TaxID=37928 RepID=UPI001237740C